MNYIFSLNEVLKNTQEARYSIEQSLNQHSNKQTKLFWILKLKFLSKNTRKIIRVRITAIDMDKVDSQNITAIKISKEKEILCKSSTEHGILNKLCKMMP